MARSSAGNSLSSSRARTRGVSANGCSPVVAATAAAQAFAGPEGHVANAEAEQPPARVLLKVDAVSVPEFSTEAQAVYEIREQLAEGHRLGQGGGHSERLHPTGKVRGGTDGAHIGGIAEAQLNLLAAKEAYVVQSTGMARCQRESDSERQNGHAGE